MMRPRCKVLWVSFVTVALLFGLVGSVTAASGKDYPDKTMTFIAQSKPGTGLDTTIRAIATTLIQEKLVPPHVGLPVINMGGAPQAILNIVTRHKNDANMLSVSSIGSMAAYSTGVTPFSHKDLTPIARLISGYYGVFVRADSPYKTLGELVKDLKSNPGGTPLTGGRGDDRLFYGALFSRAGVDITKINYVAFAGGAEASTTILEGTAKALATGVDDVTGLVEGGRLRPLAISSAQRQMGLYQNCPTMQEAGINLVWENFRYAIGPPGYPDYAKKYWQGTLTRMVKTPTWQDLLKKYRWGDSFMVEGFDKYLDEMQALVTEVVVKMGMDKEVKK